MTPPRIAVVGSLNVDHFSFVDKLPSPGETVTAKASLTRFGGKGANQAVAAARLSAEVALCGCVGDDDAGARYREHLADEKVATAGIAAIAGGVPTGSAMITVESGGENCIIVNPGANGTFTAADVEARRAEILAADGLILQLETPLASVLAAARIASDAGIPIFLNPSPWRDDFPWGELPLHAVIVNESEAAHLIGTPPTPGADLTAALERLAITILIVTRGSRSTLAFTGNENLEIAAFTVEPVDTVGAGDTFAGAAAVALLEGRPLVESLRFANAAGALATLQPGAQESMPARSDVEKLLS